MIEQHSHISKTKRSDGGGFLSDGVESSKPRKEEQEGGKYIRFGGKV